MPQPDVDHDGQRTGPARAAAFPHEPAPRLISPDLRSALERFNDAQLLSAGQVNLLGLDAIAVRLGARWPARAPSIHEQVARILERHLAREAFYDRVSETDFIVVQPSANRYAAQATCLKCLREVLTFFLGDDRDALGGVFSVLKISDDTIDVGAIEPGALAILDIPEAVQRQAAPAEPRRPTRFLAAGGKWLVVSSTMDAVYELKGFRRIGQRVARKVSEADSGRVLTYPELLRLSRRDLVELDLATVNFGIERLSQASSGPVPSLIIPVTFPTLNSTEGRLAVLEALGQASRLVSRGLICEITPIDDVPISALTDAVSFIRPHVLFVVGRCCAPEQRRDSVRQAGLHGISLRSRTFTDETEFQLWSQTALANVRRITRSVLVFGVESPQRGAQLGAAGATHVSLSAPGPSALTIPSKGRPPSWSSGAS